jgi:phosphohistidine phosphatase
MRTLVIVRHAKAESSGPTDHERVLARSGHADAAEAGSWLAGEDITPDRALVSSATRTRQTWEDLATGAGWDPALAEHSEALYSAESDTALDLVRETSEDVEALLVLGHNPTIGYLAQLLDDGDGEPDAVAQVAVGGYPTSAVSVFEYDGRWADLAAGSATLRAYHVGQG